MIFKQNHQVRLLVLAFTTIYSIFLRLFVLFAYGRLPVWPVLERLERDCPHKSPCALLVFKHVMSSYVIVWRSFINNSRFFRPKHDKKVVWSFIFCIAKPALLISKEWLFYINYCMIVSKQIMMSIIA